MSSDLIAHYIDGPASMPMRMREIERRLADLLLPGYRRDGQEAPVFFPPGEAPVEEVFEQFTGPNEVLVSDQEGLVSPLPMPPYGVMIRGSSATPISSGALGASSILVRNGGPGSGGVADDMRSLSFGPGSSLMRTRGTGGPAGQDLLTALSPGAVKAEVADAQTYSYNGSTTQLTGDGPYMFSSNSTSGTFKRYDTPLQGDFRPGAEWHFAAPNGAWAGGVGPDLRIRATSGTRINNSTATFIAPAQRQLVKLVAVGRHNSLDHYVCTAYNIGAS